MKSLTAKLALFTMVTGGVAVVTLIIIQPPIPIPPPIGDLPPSDENPPVQIEMPTPTETDLPDKEDPDDGLDTPTPTTATTLAATPTLVPTITSIPSSTPIPSATPPLPTYTISCNLERVHVGWGEAIVIGDSTLFTFADIILKVTLAEPVKDWFTSFVFRDNYAIGNASRFDEMQMIDFSQGETEGHVTVSIKCETECSGYFQLTEIISYKHPLIEGLNERCYFTVPAP